MGGFGGHEDSAPVSPWMKMAFVGEGTAQYFWVAEVGGDCFDFVKNKSMFPFNNTVMSQYMADMYQSANNSMPSNFFSVPDDSVAFWNPIKHSDGPQENPYFQSPF